MENVYQTWIKTFIFNNISTVHAPSLSRLTPYYSFSNKNNSRRILAYKHLHQLKTNSCRRSLNWKALEKKKCHERYKQYINLLSTLFTKSKQFDFKNRTKEKNARSWINTLTVLFPILPPIILKHNITNLSNVAISFK